MSSSTEVDTPLIPVIISGGSGTRLWPLSREARPKQFLPLLGPQSLFQQTLLRARGLGQRVQPPIVVCNAAHRELVAEQAREIGVEPQAVVLEPVGRNTAPAVAVAALLAARAVGRSGVDPLLLVLPADHVIADNQAFASGVHVAVQAASAGRLVTFGVVPDRPETGYGYIQRGAARGDWFEITRFVEKPDLATAQGYLASGDYSWNSGMFLFSAQRLLVEMRLHAPPIFDACDRIVSTAEMDGRFLGLGSEFSQCPANSIDYAVMENTVHGAVVPLAAGWSDVGSWSALHDVSPRDQSGNVASGNVMIEGCRNTYVVGNRRLVATVGVDNVIVVETDDAVLVVHRDRAQDVKKVVDALKASKRNET